MGQSAATRDDEAERKAFSERMHEICSDMGVPAGRGRQTALAKLFDVNAKAARRWLVGEGYPETALAVAIARWADVNYEWLMTGRGPKRGTTIDMGGLVFSEVLNSYPKDRRDLVLDVMRGQLEASRGTLTPEQQARYLRALESLRGSKH